MKTVLVFILVIATGHAMHSVGRFGTFDDCNRARKQIEAESDSTPGMQYIKGICVEARVLP